MLSPLTQAQSVRARRNWMRARDLYFGGKAGEPGADRQHEGGTSASRRFDERQGYGVNNDLADRLAEGLGIKDDATTSSSHANVAPTSDSESGARFSVSRQKVQNYISAIEEALDACAKIQSATTAAYDKQLMGDLVIAANRKRPGLNAHHVIGPENFAEKVVELLEKGETSFRLLVRDYVEGTHFMAFDVNHAGWGLSVVGIEPVAVGPNCEIDLAPRCRDSLREKIHDVAFMVVESEMQASCGVCGMFSLFLVKAMFKMADEMISLHGDNLIMMNGMMDGMAGSGGENISTQTPWWRASGDILSPRFMKHAQSDKRLVRYFLKNRGRKFALSEDGTSTHAARADQDVNKRGESLADRYTRHWGEWSEFGGKKRWFSRSIEVKRLAEYQALLAAIDEQNSGEP